MYKVLIGQQTKGGTTQQQADSVVLAAQDLESQLNDPKIGVQSIEGILVHDSNPLFAEIIAVVCVEDAPAAEVKQGE